MRSNLAFEDVDTAERTRVQRWRFDQLLEAGYAAQDASAMALDTRIDLDFARRLVQRLGCPPALAARILT